MLISTEYRSFFFLVLATGWGALRAERASELHRPKSEAVAKTVRRARQLLKLCAAFGGEQVELLRAMRQPAEAHSQKTDFAFVVSMLKEQRLKDGENIGIELRRLTERFGSRVGVETGVTNGEGERTRSQARLAQALAGFL